ncbi:MAG: histidinol dehydrogenase [bacterium]|nr:histidinol dehydrogenase [bacterium]
MLEQQLFSGFKIETTIDAADKMAARIAQLFHNHGADGQDIHSKLQNIQLNVAGRGDKALIDYTRQFDRINTAGFTLRVSPEELKEAYSNVPEEFVTACKTAIENIRTYHQHQIPRNWHKEENGRQFGLQYSPIEKAGLYVPGGRALYPSTVLMNAIPAQIAGVKELVMVTPPQRDGNVAPQVLVAADLCGIKTVRKVGGAQAIFALANGTESVPKVDKIVGPGNIWVTRAKQMVYGLVDIDKPAGPSEVLVYVEDIAYAPYAAAELWAQLEHDPLASAICISTKRDVLEAVSKAAAAQLPHLKRQDILAKSQLNGLLIQAKDQSDAISMMNHIASEHLVLCLDDYKPVLEQVKHAGSIFCGPYTPVALGDYFAGPNHVLPTERAARYASPLGVMDFMKYSSYMSYDKQNLYAAAPHIKSLTDMEGFDAHFASVDVRTKNEQN